MGPIHGPVRLDREGWRVHKLWPGRTEHAGNSVPLFRWAIPPITIIASGSRFAVLLDGEPVSIATIRSLYFRRTPPLVPLSPPWETACASTTTSNSGSSGSDGSGLTRATRHIEKALPGLESREGVVSLSLRQSGGARGPMVRLWHGWGELQGWGKRGIRGTRRDWPSLRWTAFSHSFSGEKPLG